MTDESDPHNFNAPAAKFKRVTRDIIIERPVPVVYGFWRNFENLPHFMRHMQSVRAHDTLRSHWVVSAFGGEPVEWDAEIVEDKENEKISWRSLPGAPVVHSGSVWFTPTPGGDGTEIRLSLEYVPPAVTEVAVLSNLVGLDIESEVEEELQRLKRLLETEPLPHQRPESERPAA